MSIIYDALQKTQRNREYLKLQHAITPIKPHRRNLKWMVLGGLLLVLTAGMGGLITFYWPSIKVVPSAQPSVRQTHQAVAKPQAPANPVSAHFWVTDANRSSPPKPTEPLATVTSAPKVLAQAVPALALSVEAVRQKAAPLQQEISTALNHSKLILNGVMISGTERMVLINNQAFHVGDVVDGMKILSIEFSGVKVQKDQKIVELRVPV